VVKHEHFKELCAAASIGQATAQELFELEQHAAECAACQKAYWDYLDLAAKQFAERHDSPRLSPRDAQDSLNSELFTRRFFERANKEGIVFSQNVRDEARKLGPRPEVLPRKPWWPRPAMALAASIAIAAFVSAAFFYGKGSFQSGLHPAPSESNASTAIDAPVLALNRQIAELTAVNLRFESEMDGLKAELRKANKQLNVSGTELQSADRNRRQLEAQRDALDARVQNLQKDLYASQASVNKAQQESARVLEHAGNLEDALVAERVQIADLTEELKAKSAALDKERQLLAVRHDVTDLMGARNLHIVDVVDTDPRGKTRPSFGRIFFTEGKSLRFYAYDLDEAKLQKSNYQYKVWGRKEGQDKQVRSLGIFYSDDKAQRRWTFQCDDPKTLTDLDSVFVTVESPQADPSHPHGPNLMYAYLRGQPNHP
jgi:DNA repair exonuclease SbcCD ATPase subunit